MSTKSTIVYGNGFHLYFDHADEKVHLGIESKDFECGSGEVTVTLPRGALEAIAESREVWRKCMGWVS
jgi:hypothetical protein